MSSAVVVNTNTTTVSSFNNLGELIDALPKNQTIGDNFIRGWAKINSPKYERIGCFISGGSDSDIVLDICTKIDKDHKITYFWCDTGLEMQSTKDHLFFLEKKYGIKIIRVKALKSVPLSVKQHGQPFLSKMVSEYMERLQRRNFKWEDKPFFTLLDEYCKKAVGDKLAQLEERRKRTGETTIGKGKGAWCYINNNWYNGCISALMWWCNCKSGSDDSQFDIDHNPYLKEFIMANPPTFNISNKCCKYAKKDVAHNIANNFFPKLDLIITGVRKAEGGSRATAYKSCFTSKESDADQYRPIFWYTDQDKREYEKHFGVTHSRCYTEYGLKRTGCCCCPFALGLENELEVAKKYEPLLYKAVNNVFKDSYAYTKAYREFAKEKRKENTNKF